MKLKKLLTPVCCAIVVAMGLTLTGCDLNVGDILDEISSVVNEEIGSDTDYESSSDKDSENSNGNENSTDANTESSNGGTWVQTETRYFAYENGEQQYVSKQNEYYKYRCYYRGVTEDNFVKFQVSGGYYDYSGDSKKNSTCDAYHLCSVPETSYPAGGLVTLTAKNYEENVIGWGHGGSSSIGINHELKEADGKKEDPFVHPSGMWSLDFYSADGEKGWIDMGKSNTFTANMPEDAEIGDRIAIIFQGSTAYDSWSDEPQNDYGGYVWYAWIYTYTENA